MSDPNTSPNLGTPRIHIVRINKVWDIVPEDMSIHVQIQSACGSHRLRSDMICRPHCAASDMTEMTDYAMLDGSMEVLTTVAVTIFSQNELMAVSLPQIQIPPAAGDVTAPCTMTINGITVNLYVANNWSPIIPAQTERYIVVVVQNPSDPDPNPSDLIPHRNAVSASTNGSSVTV